MAEVNRYLSSVVANPQHHGYSAGGNSNSGGSRNSNNSNTDAAAYNCLSINTNSSNSRSSLASSNPSPRLPVVPGNSPPDLSPRPPPTSGPGSGKGIDVHPFSRGSVIEVLYVKRKKVHKEAARASLDGVEEEGYGGGNNYANNWEDDESISDWFGSDDDDDDDDGDDGKKAKNSKDKKESNNSNVYLADIIDRLPLYPQLENTHPSQTFKYYIHYRDFNRRMDEWITQERIVSPPSVGNARVRALKRKKDRRKRDEEERKERERILNEVHNSGVGSMGRRDNARNRSLQEELSDLGDEHGSAAIGGVGRKRLRRAASSGDDLWDANMNPIATTTSLGDADESGRSTRRQRSVGVGGVVASTSATSSTALSAIAEEHTAVDVVTTIAAQTLDEHEGMDAAALKEHEEVTKVKNVGTLELGKYQMDTWYFSPLPKELLVRDKGMIDVLYVDEFSLNFFTRKEELLRYQRKELLGRGRRHPPGNEIYRCGNLSMFEVDGFEQRLFCQNLCYIAKLFLDHKTLYFDVDPFLFYVLCELDERGYHPVGYYSKEKYSDVGYNLACILTFPSHQRKGYGRFLIAFSYELSKKEEKVGSPEKPMSDLGQQAYIPYWTSTIVDFLLNHSGDSKSMSIMDIAKKTSIMAEDIIFALNTLELLKFVNGVYFIYAERAQLEELAKKHPVKEPRVDPGKLHWTPYINDVKRDKFSISSKKPSVEAETSSAH